MTHHEGANGERNHGRSRVLPDDPGQDAVPRWVETGALHIDLDTSARATHASICDRYDQIADSNSQTRATADLARERWSGPAEIADRSNATFHEIGDLIRCHLREVIAQEHSEADRGRTVLSDACRELLEPVQALLSRVGFVQ